MRKILLDVTVWQCIVSWIFAPSWPDKIYFSVCQLATSHQAIKLQAAPSWNFFTLILCWAPPLMSINHNHLRIIKAHYYGHKSIHWVGLELLPCRGGKTPVNSFKGSATGATLCLQWVMLALVVGHSQFSRVCFLLHRQLFWWLWD